MADAKDFLFEIGTEEMPSAPLNNAVKQLGTMIAKGLDDAGLAHGEVRVISSPRRLAALVANVATATDEVHEVKRGPAANIAFDADGNATKAAQGFARKCGVAAEDLIRREDTDGREYVFAEKNIPSAPGYADSDRAMREDYRRPAVAQLPLSALGSRACDLCSSGSLDLLPSGRGRCARVVCRRDEWQHHAWSSRARSR